MATSPRPATPKAGNARRTLLRIVIYLLIGYLLLCVILFLEQNSLLYPRASKGGVLTAEAASARAAQAGLKPWPLASNPADPQGYVPLHFTDPAPRGTIILFHGNGGWAGERTAYVDAFTRRGFRTFLYEYPGYGGRPGTPGESVIVPDAQALIRSLDQQGYGPIYVWGESLGAGVASAVCADPTLPVHGLVLLTPWDTLANAAFAHYPYVPVSLILKEKYDSIGNLQHFPHPICVVRSENDEVIPPRLNLNLYDHLPTPKKIILQEKAGHDDWPRTPELAWWDDALNFIAPVK